MRAVVARAFPIGAIGLLFLLLASPAAACNCPTLMVTGPTGSIAAGPGDPANYKITQLTDGAKWSLVYDDGTEIDHGTSVGNEVRGTFVVPDRGSASRRVGVEALIVHEDFDQSECSTRPASYLDYSVPKPPPANPEGEGAPQGSERPSQDAPPPLRQHRELSQEPSGRGPEQPALAPFAPQGSPSAPATHTAPAEVTSTSEGASHVVTAASSVVDPDAARPPPRRIHAVSAGPPNGPGAAVPFRGELTTAYRAGDEASDGRFPLAAGIALAVLIAGAIAGGGWALLRMRRDGPEPDPEVIPPQPAPTGATGVDIDAELSRLLAGEIQPVDQDEVEPVADSGDRLVSA